MIITDYQGLREGFAILRWRAGTTGSNRRLQVRLNEAGLENQELHISAVRAANSTSLKVYISNINGALLSTFKLVAETSLDLNVLRNSSIYSVRDLNNQGKLHLIMPYTRG